MVLASNEWLNNCDDGQKSAIANTNITTNTTTTTTTSATATTTSAADNLLTTETLTNNITAIDIPTSAVAAISSVQTSATATFDNANNEQIRSEATEPNKDSQQQKLAAFSLINTNCLSMMAENKNEKQKNETDTDSSTEGTTIATDSTTTQAITTNFVCDNNNRSFQNVTLSNSVNAEAQQSAVDDNNSNSNDNLNLNSNSNTVSNLNSNTSTLQPSSIARQPLTAIQTQNNSALPLSSPITPQALSSALQSVMNSAHNNSATGNALQSNFLCSLGIGVNAAAALQQTAKQLSSTFSALDATQTTNLTNNSSEASETSFSVVDSNGQPKIILLCEANSHPFQTRTILLTPNIECKVGRLIAKSKASESNAIFDCKVLSRNHAVLWYSDDGKFWVKDTKSSNGTFINENKLGTEAAELHFGDIVKFGVDVVENSRKEVHGCIIACVKLYLPDGRESSQYSGEGRISFDELHRLNLYMQEASQREKVLKSKLFNIQNILDATRKNSALCWQSMIAEDQLLHRIHSLEKKLQVMEKNVPESVLRNEVLKLLDDKNSYQHTAKEALRKVYQERCDAMQMLSKMESAYTTSDNECKILRDQIMNTKQSLQDVNTRLQRLVSEYNEFKDETERQQQEAKDQEEQRTAELTDKLRQREQECEELKRKISELLIKRADLLDDEEQLQKQAIEKLDAAIADMDLGDDYDEDENDEEMNEEKGDHINKEAKEKGRQKKANLNESDVLNGKTAADGSSSSSSNSSGSVNEKTNSNSSPKSDEDKTADEPKQKVAKDSTIMKWLQNSDLNKKEGSLDIFNAICNESDSSDEQETKTSPDGNKKTGAGTSLSAEDFVKRYVRLTNKMQSVQKKLKQWEVEMYSENIKTENLATVMVDNENGTTTTTTVAGTNDDSDEDEADDDDDDADEFIIKRNGKLNEVLQKSDEKKEATLMQTRVSQLLEACNEICESMKDLHPTNQKSAKQATPPPAISVQTQFQNYAPNKPSNSAAKKLDTQETLKPLTEANNEEEDENDDDEDDDSSARFSITSQRTIIKEETEAESNEDTERKPSKSREENKKLQSTIREFQEKLDELNTKLEQSKLIENDSQNTLEMLQIECEADKDKIDELKKLIETLRDDKQALQQVISENKSNSLKSRESHEVVNELIVETILPIAVAPEAAKEVTTRETFEQQMCEDLATINLSAVQREEELIVYKERLEKTQNDNLQLRNDIADLKLKANDYAQSLLLKRVLPYGACVVAILAYFISTIYIYRNI